MNQLNKESGRQVCSVPTGRFGPCILVDSADLPAFKADMAFRVMGGRWQVRAIAWRRWRDVSVYLTGTMCYFRNGDDRDFRRANLIPAARPWASSRQKYT